MLDAALQRLWYGRSPLSLLLLPLSLLFLSITALRRHLYRIGAFSSERVTKPVIVVGNITVGGTGKTPFVIWLSKELRARGHVPGLIVRGYGGRADRWPRDVDRLSDPVQVGDEAVLLAEQTEAIVVAGPDRVSAAKRAIERGATIVISDDGLQHYRLSRDAEIAIVDAARGLGNGWLLPAGPLREPRSRLGVVDAVVFNCRGESNRGESMGISHSDAQGLTLSMTTRLGAARSLTTNESRSLASFAGQRLHAIAGIGNPHSFFDSLRAAGLALDVHAFPDHAEFSPESIRFPDSAPVLMTEKDAVKCRGFADSRCWAVSLDVQLDRASELLAVVVGKLDI